MTRSSGQHSKKRQSFTSKAAFKVKRLKRKRTRKYRVPTAPDLYGDYGSGHKDDFRRDMSDERLFEMVAAWLWGSYAAPQPTDNNRGYVKEFGLRLFTKSRESRRNDVVGKLRLDSTRISNSL